MATHLTRFCHKEGGWVLNEASSVLELSTAITTGTPHDSRVSHKVLCSVGARAGPPLGPQSWSGGNRASFPIHHSFPFFSLYCLWEGECGVHAVHSHTFILLGAVEPEPCSQEACSWPLAQPSPAQPFGLGNPLPTSCLLEPPLIL